MTDDPIRERVARAIYEAQPYLYSALGGSKTFDEIDHGTLVDCLHKADAALLACGYEEMRRALEAAEKAERYHMNCKHCDGLDQPEVCEKCFPKADDARLLRWAALTAIGSKLAPRKPRAALSRTQGEVG